MVAPRVIMYPADEQKIAEIERGRICRVDVPPPPGGVLAVGDTILFALGLLVAGREATYVKGGDSVLVSLTGVTDLGAKDPLTGEALVHLSWDPLGQGGPKVVAAGRVARPPRPRILS